MYMPTAFSASEQSQIDAHVDRHRLATVVMVVASRPHIDHIPFLRMDSVTAGGTLIAHVSKANPTWKHIDSGSDATLVFTGASAYVSPSLYPTKKKTHEVVPTWNYASVHLHGRIFCLHERDAKYRIVDALTQAMETERPEPWSITDAPGDYLEKMLMGIVGLKFVISSVDAKFKASQNRLLEDREGVIEGLAQSPQTQEAAAIAAAALRKEPS